MTALYNFVQKIRTDVPARHASCVGKSGPVAWLGLNTMGRKPELAACSAVKRTFLNSVNNGGCDYYADIVWHPQGSPAIEAPPPTVSQLPILEVGDLHNDVEIDDWDKACNRDSDCYKAVFACVSSLSEKGYIPVSVADSPHVTVAALDAIKQVGHDNVVVVHLSAHTRLSAENGAMKRACERNLVKGVSQFGQRSVTATARKMRKNYEVRYADAHALYDRGLFTLKDIRNGFPVYLSVDLSVLEPAFAPAAFQPECGGFSVRETIHLIDVLRAPNIIGMDIHGFDPQLDIYRGGGGGGKPGGEKNVVPSFGGEGLTSLAAGKLVKEMVLKALSCSTKTRFEISEQTKRDKLMGSIPQQYPDM